MVFYNDMAGWHNTDANGQNTIRLARLSEIQKFGKDIPEAKRHALLDA